MALSAIGPRDGAIPKLEFSTAPHAGADAFEYWRDRISGYYESIAGAGEDSAFQVQASSWNIGGLIATHTRSTAREQLRTAAKIRTDQIDHYRLILQLDGTLRLDADGRRAQVMPGQLLITDMARPKRYVVSGGSNIILIVPRHRLDAVLPRALDLHGVAPQGVGATLLATQLRGMVDHANAMVESDASSLSQSLLHMIAAAVTPSASQLADQDRQSVEGMLLRQICRHVELHIHDEGMSPVTLAAQFKVSRATLYRLFEPVGGVAAFIREKRLARVHGLLSAPERRYHMATLAELHGFSDATTLSRAFKQHFGYSPSEVRQSLATPSPARQASPDTTVGDWMNTLRTRAP